MVRLSVWLLAASLRQKKRNAKTHVLQPRLLQIAVPGSTDKLEARTVCSLKSLSVKIQICGLQKTVKAMGVAVSLVQVAL